MDFRCVCVCTEEWKQLLSTCKFKRRDLGFWLKDYAIEWLESWNRIKKQKPTTKENSTQSKTFGVLPTKLFTNLIKLRTFFWQNMTLKKNEIFKTSIETFSFFCFPCFTKFNGNTLFPLKESVWWWRSSPDRLKYYCPEQGKTSWKGNIQAWNVGFKLWTSEMDKCSGYSNFLLTGSHTSSSFPNLT